MARVSVVMSTFNGAKFLLTQLESIAAQQLPPLELIVRDDGSTDQTTDVIAQFSEHAPFPVRLLRGADNIGYRASFLQAASSAKGDLVAFCDQDDIWYPNKLSTLAEAIERDPAILLVYHATDIVRDGAPVQQTITEEAPSSWFRGTFPRWSFPPGHTQFFRRSLLEFSDLWPLSADPNERGQRLAHDQYYFFLASALGTIAFVHEPLMSYRLHGDSYSFRFQTMSALQRIMAKAESPVVSLERSRAATVGLQRIFGRISKRQDIPESWRVAAAENAAAWTAASLAHMKRAAIYEAAGLERLAALRRFSSGGGYSGNKEFSYATMAKDIVFGLLLNWKPHLPHTTPHHKQH